MKKIVYAVVANMKTGKVQLNALEANPLSGEFSKVLNGIYPIFEKKKDAKRFREEMPILSLRIVKTEITI